MSADDQLLFQLALIFYKAGISIDEEILKLTAGSSCSGLGLGANLFVRANHHHSRRGGLEDLF